MGGTGRAGPAPGLASGKHPPPIPPTRGMSTQGEITKLLGRVRPAGAPSPQPIAHAPPHHTLPRRPHASRGRGAPPSPPSAPNHARDRRRAAGTSRSPARRRRGGTASSTSLTSPPTNASASPSAGGLGSSVATLVVPRDGRPRASVLADATDARGPVQRAVTVVSGRRRRARAARATDTRAVHQGRGRRRPPRSVTCADGPLGHDDGDDRRRPANGRGGPPPGASTIATRRRRRRPPRSGRRAGAGAREARRRRRSGRDPVPRGWTARGQRRASRCRAERPVRSSASVRAARDDARPPSGSTTRPDRWPPAARRHRGRPASDPGRGARVEPQVPEISDAGATSSIAYAVRVGRAQRRADPPLGLVVSRVRCPTSRRGAATAPSGRGPAVDRALTAGAEAADVVSCPGTIPGSGCATRSAYAGWRTVTSTAPPAPKCTVSRARGRRAPRAGPVADAGS